MPNSGEILLDGENITDWILQNVLKTALHMHFQQPVRFKGVTVEICLICGRRTFVRKRYAPYSVKSVFVQEIILKRDVDAVFRAVKAKG